MNKKILFVVNVDWFFISHRLPLAMEALKRGYDVHIACGITDKHKYLEELGLNVHGLNLLRSNTGLIYEIKTFIEIFMVLKKVKPDIVHFVTIKPVIYGGIASRFLNIQKKVFSISGLGFIFINQGIKASIIRFIIKFMYRIALDNNSFVIVQNNSDKNLILSIKKNRVLLIRGSGVDLNHYQYHKEENKNIKVVMACRLLKDKGVFEYIEAAKIIKNKGYDVEFILYGDIDEFNPATLSDYDIKRITKDSCVKIFGFNNDITDAFSKANIVVLPSYREGLPKVLIEAAACGRAVVTTDVPGCRDAIEPNVTGLLCNVKDPASLADKIEILIKDEELRKEMGKAGRILAEKEFDINKVVSKHFEIYENEK